MPEVIKKVRISSLAWYGYWEELRLNRNQVTVGGISGGIPCSVQGDAPMKLNARQVDAARPREKAWLARKQEEEAEIKLARAGNTMF